jgi:predicted ATPase
VRAHDTLLMANCVERKGEPILTSASIIVRFITLVDCIYDHGVRLICSAETAPEQLFNDDIIAPKDDASRMYVCQI